MGAREKKLAMGRGRGKRKKDGSGSAAQSPVRGPASTSDAPAPPPEDLAAAVSQKLGKRGVSKERVQSARQEPVQSESFLKRVLKQLEFYFSDANLRRDAFLRRKIQEGNGYVELATILQFNRIRNLRCFSTSQLVQVIRKSEMLVLNESKTKVARDEVKAPIEKADPLPRTIYVEGLPVTVNRDILNLYLAKYGRVCYVDLPCHGRTREPLGFCFVEYASEQEAAVAAKGLNGFWPGGWPTRYDNKALKAMSKKAWLDYRKEFQALQQRKCQQRRSLPGQSQESARPTPEDGSRATSSGSQPREVAGETAAPAVSSTAPATNPRSRQGCIIRVSGFSEPQTRISVRQFVEHSVTVEYCDYTPGDSVAHVRLKCPEDCHALVADLAKTSRYLGWLRPAVSILSPEEEKAYWLSVDSQRSSAKSETGNLGAAFDVSRKQVRRIARNPLGLIRKGPSKTTTLHLFRGSVGDDRGIRKGAAASSSSSAVVPDADKADTDKVVKASRRGAGSYVDIAGGSTSFSQAGFGKPRLIKKRLFGMRSRLRKIGADVSPTLRPSVVSTVAPASLPKGLKNLQIAPPTQRPRQSSMQGDASASDKTLLPPPALPVKRPNRPLESGVEAEAPPSKVRITDFEPMLLPMLPPPSPGVLLKSAKAKKYPAPQRQSTQEALFPPPSPVALPQDSRKQKRSRSPARHPQAVRKPATGVTPLLLPPPSPIARRPDEKSSAAIATTTSTAAVQAEETGSPGTGAGGSAPAAPEDVPAKIDLKDSMLDQVDMDDFLSLMEG